MIYQKEVDKYKHIKAHFLKYNLEGDFLMYKRIKENKNNDNKKFITKLFALCLTIAIISVFTLNVKAANQESLNTLDVEEYLANTTNVEDESIEDEEVDIEEIQKEVIETSTSTVEEFKIDSRIGLIYDRASGKIIYEKNGNKQTPMASTTKIMTAIVVLENANLKDTVTIDSKTAGIGGSRLGLKNNDKITVNDLLYGLMLRSR